MEKGEVHRVHSNQVIIAAEREIRKCAYKDKGCLIFLKICLLPFELILLSDWPMYWKYKYRKKPFFGVADKW